MEQDAHYTPNGLKSRALPSTVSSSNATESGCYNWDNKFSSDDNIDLDITDESRVAFIDNNSKETNFQTEHLRKKTSENGVVMSIKGEVTSPRRNDLKNVDSRWSIAVAVVSLFAQEKEERKKKTKELVGSIMSKRASTRIKKGRVEPLVTSGRGRGRRAEYKVHLGWQHYNRKAFRVVTNAKGGGNRTITGKAEQQITVEQIIEQGKKCFLRMAKVTLVN